MLEDHGAAVAHGGQLLLRHGRGEVCGEFARERKDAGVGHFKPVEAPQDSCLARSGRPDQSDDFAAPDVDVDRFQHVVPAEGLPQPRHGSGWSPRPSGRESVGDIAVQSLFQEGLSAGRGTGRLSSK